MSAEAVHPLNMDDYLVGMNYLLSLLRVYSQERKREQYQIFFLYIDGYEIKCRGEIGRKGWRLDRRNARE
jgi:hypothetical protein